MIEQRIQQIKEAETRAAEIVSKAREEAEKMNRRAGEERLKILEKAREEASKEADAIKANALLIAQKKEQLARESLQKELERLKAQAEQNRSKAYEFLINWLEEEWAPNQLPE